jgi:carbon-monoxide dehydrogenase medium subunit
VKAAAFSYARPTSVAEAVGLLRERAGEARVLAGGQSLVPMLGMRIMRPAILVDVNELELELGRIDVDGDDTVLGALVRYAEIESDPEIAERLPLLAHVVLRIGDRQVRNRGTIGGALAQSDPTGEMALASLALDATLVLRDADGERDVPAREFFVGAYHNVLEPDELLVAVRFPRRPDRFAFFERGRKHNDFALLSVAAVADVAPPETPGAAPVLHDVRIALGGVHDRPVLAEAAAAALEGRPCDEAAIAEAAALTLEAIDPPDDIRGSAEYRRHLVPVHVRRVLQDLVRGDDA